MAFARLFVWIYNGPFMHLLYADLDRPIWWPHHMEEPDTNDADSTRPPQLNTQHMTSRDGCACFSSRESTTNDDDDDDSSLTAVDSVDGEELNSESSYGPGTPVIQPLPWSPNMNVMLDHMDNSTNEHHHRRSCHLFRTELTDSMEVWAPSSPTDSLMLEGDRWSPQPSVLGMDMVQDYLEDLNCSAEPGHVPHIDTPLVLTHLPQSAAYNRTYILNCKHIHTESCFEEC